MIMKVPDKAIRIAIAALLADAGILTRAETARPDDLFPRVRITGMSSLNTGSKSQYMYTTTCTLVLEDRRVNIGSVNEIDDLADTIMGRLVPSIQGEPFNMDGYRVKYVDYTSTPLSTFESKPYIYTNKNIRLTIQTEQI